MVLLLLNCNTEAPVVDGKKLPDQVSFNFHVRPILSDRCFSCHGPDEAARKGGLRLDLGEETYSMTSQEGSRILVPGSTGRSVLWERLQSEDEEVMMPPPTSELDLSEYEKGILKRWIEQGAEFEPHWSFMPVEAPELPQSSSEDLSSIDAIVRQRLDREGLSAAEEADPELLIRRLTFDLTGFAPTIDEVRKFVNDSDLNAYESLVDGLLATDAYAEQMTVSWLDLARYADSQGMHSDGYRSMYPWRDWVIKAFRDNMPYDQFILEQIAGDLLEDPTTDQLVATGFNRNNQTTAEGGAVDEEFKKEYAHDRVATTATGMLGLTLECARCHDHKYDPISQKEYYEFFAFFNQIDEVGLTGDDGNSGPNLLIPGPVISEKIDSIAAYISAKEAEEIAKVKQVSVAHLSTQVKHIDHGIGRQIFLPLNSRSEKNVDRVREAEATEGLDFVESSRGKVASFDAEYDYLSLKGVGLFEHSSSFAASIWIHPDGIKTTQTLMGNSGQKGVFWRGWDFALDSINRPQLRLINTLPQDMLVVRASESVPVKEWTHLAFSYDGTGSARGVKIFINGEEADLNILKDQLRRSIYPISFSKKKTDVPLRVGKSYRAFTGEYGIYVGLMDDLMVFERPLSPLEVRHLYEGTSYKKSWDPSKESSESLREYWYTIQPKREREEFIALKDTIIELWSSAPEVMVMKENEERRPTHILLRGNYDELGEVVEPSTPAAILEFGKDLPPNRLGLAKWMLDKKNPLTSRVFVNRLWQQFFGQGIVGSAHDFGLQGDLPTHPELLDYLAFTFMENDWDVKRIVKEIVMSKTYRQSSKSSTTEEVDPNNTLLSRGPSARLTAEMLRDQSLAASELLDERVGGPSVKPWQPEGLWREKTSSTHILAAYEPDAGSDRYRRSMYTFVRRTSMHPMMETFDAPTRSVCVVKRQRTSTPLQALVLLNDPQFIEAARVLASREMEENRDAKEWIPSAYEKLCGRTLTDKKMEELELLFQEERKRFSMDPGSAKKYISIGQTAYTGRLDSNDLAAATLVVNTIMNLDDYYMKR